MNFNKKHITYALIGIIVAIFIGVGLYNQPQVNNDTPSKSQTSTLVAEKEESNESKPQVGSENEADSEIEETSRQNSDANQEVVQVVVDLSDINQGTLSLSINYEEGMTAMDATENALRSAGISYSVISSGASAYMEGINNVYEFDHGPTSGFQVEVNGSHSSNSADVQPVYPDSHVYWYYTTDFTK